MSMYGEDGEWAFIPVSVGLFLGAVFVWAADILISSLGVSSPLHLVQRDSESPAPDDNNHHEYGDHFNNIVSSSNGELRHRHVRPEYSHNVEHVVDDKRDYEKKKSSSWRRILLLIVAVTIHNIPEGLAVGVGFGAVGRSKSATFQSARNLALGIGIQNFPEGIAVSLPLKAAGFSTARAIWYGQLSGLVEPVAGVLGAALVTWIVPILPYALSFAAGAMIYVVLDDIVPESQAEGNGTLATWGAIIGFIVMMSLDVSLG